MSEQTSEIVNRGRVIQVLGAVVDVEFPDGHRPRLLYALKTTNAIERINKEFKRRTKSMGSLGESSLAVIVAFVALRLEMGWQRNQVDSKGFENLPRLKGKNVAEKVVEELGLLN